jgi:hypothetical protein
MRQVLSRLCLAAGICLGAIAPVHGEILVGGKSLAGEKCSADFIAFIHWDPIAGEQYDAAQKDIDALGIGSSSNASELFKEFSKRFPVVVPYEGHGDLRDVRSILATRGGTPGELTFVLLNLLVRNGIQAEWVEIFADPKASGRIVRFLVYEPLSDQVFDPTLPDAQQHRGSGWAFLDGSPRKHFGYPYGTPAYNCNTAMRGYFAKRSPAARP